MAHPYLLALHGVDIALPDGRILFHDLHDSLGAELAALIGPNGSGKSSLGRVIAGLSQPAQGRVEHAVPVHYVEQQTGLLHATSLAQLAGLDAPLSALRRLAAGDAREDDFEIIGERWDLEARWQAMLDQAGLAESMTPASLSGGQRTLLSLIGAFCSEAGFLILDEPGNHLDRERRRFLIEQMQAWRAAGRGLLVISHDRELLEHADRTLEVHARGLRRYGGGWSLVEEQRGAELASMEARLERARVERRNAEATMRTEAERAARKSARGARAKAAGGQPKIVLNALPQRAQQTDGARAERHAQRRRDLRQDLLDAFDALDGALARPSFPLLDLQIPDGQAAVVLEELVAPWGPRQPLDWGVNGAARIAIRGPNGCGKSTLLRTIAGEIAPLSGRCRTLPAVLLDQHLAMLDPSRSLLDQLRATAMQHDEGRLRQYLALAGLKPDRVLRPSGSLSGGERMRGALLCAVLREPAPRLLLLDEPTNHLDLHGVEALEAMLQSWPGALLVVSHDERFLDRLGLTHRLDWRAGQWVAS
ncbi:ATP-binding cassette domain-containing protein [Massilia aerilata]|uniref:ATP-binding cassette domain-containing protein n=1 Tax=Massilia aerilata TaxID=453817 RepID=A0ABW0RTT8_9BURK